ncbi:MAG: hypothetical protein ACRDN9_20500, partial [Streptosporangiaceae bacterium]
VVAGGLVAAATAPAPATHGSWAAVYLVLVAGVAQVALGVGQAVLAPTPAPSRLAAGQLAAWNAGNAAVIAGTLLGVVAVVDAGGALLVVALALLVAAVRGAQAGRGWLLYAFRPFVVVLLVSIPVGLVLARAGNV